MSEDIEFPLTVAPRMAPGERARYVPNHRSFGAFIRSDQMRDVTAEAARDIAAMASSLTPDSKEGATEHTGIHARVKGGFKVKREAGFIVVGGNRRVLVEVENNEDGAAVIEHGGRGMPRSRPLGRAGAMFGDFKPDGGPS